MPPIDGKFAAAYLGAVKVSGMGTWSYTGETTKQSDIDEFLDTHVKQIAGMKVGGDITITGHYLLDTDAGQKALETANAANTQITDLKLYTDYANGVYLGVKAGSYLSITNFGNVGADKAGGPSTFSLTLHVNGELEQVGSTTAGTVVTLGVVDIAATTVTMWGELLFRADVNAHDCYFEYGTSESFGTDSKVDETVFTTPDVGTYDVEETGLVSSTLYYYRAVCELSDTSKIYGETKSFTTA